MRRRYVCFACGDNGVETNATVLLDGCTFANSDNYGIVSYMQCVALRCRAGTIQHRLQCVDGSFSFGFRGFVAFAARTEGPAREALVCTRVLRRSD